jgi:hypothetical protein
VLPDVGTQSVSDVAWRGGALYVAGTFDTVLDPDTGGPVAGVQSQGGKDQFVAKFFTAGAFLAAEWIVGIGGMQDDLGGGIAVGPGGEVVVTGSFLGSITVGGSPHQATNAPDALVVKLTPSGAITWSRDYGGGVAETGEGVTIDGAGRIFATGTFGDAVVFGDVALSSDGATDQYIVAIAP